MSLNASLTNCIIVVNAATLGGGAYSSTLYNCTLSGNLVGSCGAGAYSSTLYNCTLSGNYSDQSGGGAYSSTLYNCTLSGNTAEAGGGAEYCTLHNCTLSGNTAVGAPSGQPGEGGGALFCTLYNCTLSGNWALPTVYDPSFPPPLGTGGGALFCTLYNCIAYFNTAPAGANYALSALSYCCSTPEPGGVGNIPGPPLFVDYTVGNLRLQSNSPCINAGNNAYVFTSTDLDGDPRIVSGTVDIGAYEYQGTGSVISYAWLQQYGLPTDGSVDFIDPGGSGMNNWQDWVCGLCPTNPLSVLKMLAPSNSVSGITVSWQSVSGITYFLQRGTHLASSFTLLATNIPGQAGTTSYADTNATGAGRFFYRVGVTAP